MKSFTMKALAVAVLGLAGIGSAMAACPTIAPGTTTSAGGGGAWSSQTVTSATFVSATPGLNGTSCALSVAINAGAASNTKGFVTDTSPQNEARYRARFYINTAGLTNLSVANRQVKAFQVLATTGPVGLSTEEVSLRLVGGSPTPSFRFAIADSGAAGGTGFQTVSVPFPNAAGNYRVEIDLTQGATGSFRYWITDAAATTTDAAPTGSITVNNSGWSGAKQVNLGLSATSTNYRTSVGGQPAIFDEFDSRRQTFIGK